MSKVIRLAPADNKSAGGPLYLIVAADGRAPRSRFIEVLGVYDSRDRTLELSQARVRFWLEQGALPSDTLAELIERRLKAQS